MLFRSVQPLVVGDTDGDNTVIKEGLAAGDRVVMEGSAAEVGADARVREVYLGKSTHIGGQHG